jgi:uncharacterized protein involved in exopolysaccharide biosynthesis
MKLRTMLLAALILFVLGAVSVVNAQSEVDLIAHLLQTPESTLALVALVVGVLSVTMFIRASAKATLEADKITNRILDQYEKTAGAQVQSAEAQKQMAISVQDMVMVMRTEFANMRDIPAAIKAQSAVVAQSAQDFKAYQTLMDDTVYGMRESVLKLINRIAVIEERTEQISEKAASMPGDHARIIELLVDLAQKTRQQQNELLRYLEDYRAEKDAGQEAT